MPPPPACHPLSGRLARHSPRHATPTRTGTPRRPRARSAESARAPVVLRGPRWSPGSAGRGGPTVTEALKNELSAFRCLPGPRHGPGTRRVQLPLWPATQGPCLRCNGRQPHGVPGGARPTVSARPTLAGSTPAPRGVRGRGYGWLQLMVSYPTRAAGRCVTLAVPFIENKVSTYTVTVACRKSGVLHGPDHDGMVPGTAVGVRATQPTVTQPIFPTLPGQLAVRPPLRFPLWKKKVLARWPAWRSDSLACSTGLPLMSWCWHGSSWHGALHVTIIRPEQ